MSARILVIDDMVGNLRLMQAKLSAEYYEVLTAMRGAEGFEVARRQRPDIILLDVMMPDLDGFEVCRRLKSHPDTRHIPVIMLTALGEREDRLRGLEAGAEDFLSKPIDDVQLIARVRSLLRLKVVIDELRSREASGARLGVIEPRIAGEGEGSEHAVVLAVDDNPRQIRRVVSALADRCQVSVFGEEDHGAAPDLLIVSTYAKTFDGLKIIARLRSTEAMRHLPILAIVDPDDSQRALRSLDLGANDIIARPLDEDELRARARTLIRRKLYMDALRANLDQGLELAVTDQLTGLYNRRFLMTQLGLLLQRSRHGGEPVSVLYLDIDHFKPINDQHGHDVGDEVLKGFSARIASSTRPFDFACRLGGEEFAVIMPNTTGAAACMAAERMRVAVAATPFSAAGRSKRLDVTVSIGVACSEPEGDTPETLLKRADEALYQAKSQGRNRVIGAGRPSAAAVAKTA
jgi:two-component system cell cycle response regulator